MLVINQVNKDWSCSSEKMDAYCAEIRKLKVKFYGIEYHHVVRDQNQLADHLSKIGSSHAMILPRVFIQDLFTLSIRKRRKFKKFPHRAAGTYNTFGGHRLEGIVQQVHHQHQCTC